MASHPLIDAHLAVLAARLPSDVVDELADGLFESWNHQLGTGMAPDTAALAAITEFGDAEEVIRSFVTQAPGRRMSQVLLLTAPLVAVSWAATFIIGQAWTWTVPLPVVASLGLLLTAVIFALISSVTSRHDYGRAMLGLAAGVGVLILDTAMLAVVGLAVSVAVWPMAAAVPSSIARIALTVRGLVRAHPL